jgi:MSHA pilin protein MshC
MMESKKKGRVRSKSNQGFTLIEVVAVLIILGILGVVVVSRMSSTSTYGVKSQAEVLKSHIRYAQTMAMGTGTIWGIDVDDSKRYYLFKGTTANMVILPGADSNPVILKANEPSLSTGTVRFNGKGSPVNADGILIDDYTIFKVSMGGEEEEIKITRNTGFIP